MTAAAAEAHVEDRQVLFDDEDTEDTPPVTINNFMEAGRLKTVERAKQYASGLLEAPPKHQRLKLIEDMHALNAAT